MDLAIVQKENQPGTRLQSKTQLQASPTLTILRKDHVIPGFCIEVFRTGRWMRRFLETRGKHEHETS